MGVRCLGVVIVAFGFMVAMGVPVQAQFEMPDPKEMSGIPLPSRDLADGTISVRLILGALANNIIDHSIDLRVNEEIRTAKTNENGRAQFTGVTPGMLVSVSATVDGEQLASQAYEMPGFGGVRVMLVATPSPSPDASTRLGQEESTATGRSADLVLGGDSRFLVEIGAEQTIEFYSILEVVNDSNQPIMPAAPFRFTLPANAVNVSLLNGSSSLARIADGEVVVQGPLPPGRTPVNFAYILSYAGPTFELAQYLPVSLNQVAVIVEKHPSMDMISAQVERRREMEADGATYIVGAGPALAAGQTFDLSLTGLPYRSTTPRTVALTLAGLLIFWCVWMSYSRRLQTGRVRERETLEGKREKLYRELVRVESKHRDGDIAEAWYVKRRRELFGQLERVYRRLDQHKMSGREITASS